MLEPRVGRKLCDLSSKEGKGERGSHFINGSCEQRTVLTARRVSDETISVETTHTKQRVSVESTSS